MKDAKQAANVESIAFWNGPAGARWVMNQEILDRILEPFGQATMRAAAPKAGERIADIGCGCGSTTIRLADIAGAEGGVIGLDISAPMLARGRELAGDRSHLTFLEHDAATYSFDPPVDLVFSRFGVMFFSDPPAAFANLHRGLRAGGRLAFSCWRPVADNAWATVPFNAVAALLPAPPPPLDAPGAGPFAFADQDLVRRIVEGAGFRDVAIERFDHEVVFGMALDDAVMDAVRSAPCGRLLANASDDVRGRAPDALRAALTPYVSDRGVALSASVWIVSARA